MVWRLAKSLEVLRAEANAAYPDRDKASDGTIGDAAHAARNSDHNPWVKDRLGVGVVRAWDCDEDLEPNAGDSPLAPYAEKIRQLGAAGDPRLADWGYVIYEGRIAGGNPSRTNAWEWRPYSGSNAHKIHMHVSVSRNQAGYDSTEPWNVFTEQSREDDFMSALTPVEQREVHTWLKDLHREFTVSVPDTLDKDGYSIKAGSTRWRLTNLLNRTADLVSGRRPTKR